MIVGVPFESTAQSNTATLRVSPDSAIALALANNLELQGARGNPEIAELAIKAAEGVWRPSLLGTVGRSRVDSPASTSFDRTLSVLTDNQVSADVSLSQRLPWGTSYDVGWTSRRRSNNSLLSRFQPELNAAARAHITQPLLRGFTFDPARADRERSLQARDRAGFELDGTITFLKREVLYTYWQWVYARQLQTVATDALALARALLDGNRQRVAARAMAATDVIEAEAEVARRDEAVIISARNVANAEDRLRLLILNPRSSDYQAPLEPIDSETSDSALNGVDLVTHALVNRRDLRVLRSTIETDAVNVRQFKNDALPDINVDASFSAQAIGGTELLRDAQLGTPLAGSSERTFAQLLKDVGQLQYPGWSVQVSIGYPFGATVAKANAARAHVQQRQTELAVAALEQRVTTEVRMALREVETNEKRLQSTATAVTLAERHLAAEEQKFLVGLSTSFFVFQAQRDLAGARIARLGAVLDRQLSLVDLDAVQSAPIAPVR
jgi:outer membrane protein TolC